MHELLEILSGQVENISQVAEDTLPTPPLGTSGVAADTALRPPAAQPPTHPFPSTSDTTAGTSPQLPAVLPPTPPFLSTSDTTSGTSPQLPAVPPPFLSTSDTTAGTSPQLPAVLPPFLSTSDTTSGTSPQLPAAPPHGEIIDDSHKDDDVEKHVLARLREFLHGVQGLL
ncbi:splicing factor 3A subunit 2-like [Prunus persica]|uniref:splicing factor 3A subunit 2-like n=1 Tax=Prunus persica TaxID=3760 RepID=UPI0009AB6B61|nr:splicing factor 3A subunit 2-like [Prunus persica]